MPADDGSARGYLAWGVGNVVLGLLGAVPLQLALIVSLHLRAVAFDRPDSPFQPAEIEGGEASGMVQLTLIVVIPLAVVAVVANRALLRGLRLRSTGTRLAMVALTLALLVVPAVILWQATTA